MPGATPNSSTLRDELVFARDLALIVGARALAMQQLGSEALDTQHKPNDGGPVTKADLEANEHIVNAIGERFPGDGILAEESVNDTQGRTRERVWMIDPIDGTREFAQGLDAWAVHIGLTIGGVPALGVVARPSHGQVLWGCSGDPNAWVQHAGEGPKVLPPPAAHNPSPRIVASASRYSQRVADLSDALCIDPARRLKSGSTGVKVSLLCLGEAELYAHGSGGLSLWDTCAPMAILLAAGGRMSDLRGKALEHGPSGQRHGDGLLATRAVDHAAVVDLVNKIGSDWFDESGLTRE